MCPPQDVTNLPNPSPLPPQIPSFLPQTPTSLSAYALATTHLAPAILHHSLRTYLYASSLATSSRSPYAASPKHDLLFTACILHDIGTAFHFDGLQRFEVEGGDAAAALLKEHGWTEADVHEVWVAIALHSSAGIAEWISELSRLVRIAVLIDFGKEVFTAEEQQGGVAGVEEVLGTKRGTEERWPRLEIEKVLGDMVVEQAVRRPGKAPPASWPGILLRAWEEEPGWEGINKAF